MIFKKSILIAVAFVLLTGFWGDDDETPADKRKEIQKMRSETLSDLYRYQPQAKDEIKNSAGYAVFSNFGMNLLLLSTARGGGVAHDKASGKDTYMKMFSAGGGIGMGVKDFRGIFIFQTKSALDNFINSGWTAGGQADLILVDGNPLKDITTLGGAKAWFDADPVYKPIKTIRVVMKDGKIYRNTLR